MSNLPENRSTPLDIFRGLTLAAMLLVNHRGSAADFPLALRHSSFPGISFADLIFPAFLFIVGVSTSLSDSRRKNSGESNASAFRHAIYRAAKLFIVGCIMLSLNYMTLRFNMGTLQRIAICYLIGFSVTRRNFVVQTIALLGVIAIYQSLMVCLGAPAYDFLPSSWPLRSWDQRWVPGKTLTDLVDTLVLGKPRSEGVLTTLCASSSTIFGVIVGSLMLRKNDWRIRSVILSLLLLVAGFVAANASGDSWLFSPLSQRYWTPSYTLLTTGFSGLLFVALATVLQSRGAQKPFEAFKILGLNAIGIYVFSGLVDRFLKQVGDMKTRIDFVGLEIAGRVGAAFFYPALILALAFSLSVVLYRRRIFIRL